MTQHRFHSLLYIASRVDALPNFRSTASPIADYAALGRLLARTLQQAFGCRLTVHSNRPDMVAKLAQGEFDVAHLWCGDWVPEKAAFFPAHFKVDLVKSLVRAKEAGTVLDLDMIALGHRNLLPLLGRGILAYDISSHTFPAYTAPRVEQDLRLLGAATNDPRWYGGEFLTIPQDCSNLLLGAVDRAVERYREHWQGLHHQGDEAIMSAAIGALPTTVPVLDAGCRQVVVRQWSVQTMHAQLDDSVLESCDLVHLPSSKEWLVGLERTEKIPSSEDIRAHLARANRRTTLVKAARHVLKTFGRKREPTR